MKLKTSWLAGIQWRYKTAQICLCTGGY